MKLLSELEIHLSMKNLSLYTSSLLIAFVLLFGSVLNTESFNRQQSSDLGSATITSSPVLISAHSVEIISILPVTGTPASLLNIFPKPDSEDPRNFWNTTLKSDSIQRRILSTLFRSSELVYPGLSVRVLIYPFHSFL